MPMPTISENYRPTQTLKHYLFIKLEPEQHLIAHRLLFHSSRDLIKNVKVSATVKIFTDVTDVKSDIPF